MKTALVLTIFCWINYADTAGSNNQIRYFSPTDEDPNVELGYANVVAHANMHLSVEPGQILNSTSGISDDECILSCIDILNCTSLNYYASTTKCDVLSTDRFRSIDHFQSYQGATHFSLENDCEYPNTCPSTNYICIPYYQTFSYECICGKHHTGEWCHKDKGNINLVGNVIEVTQLALYKLSLPASHGIDGDLSTAVEVPYKNNGGWWYVKLSKSYFLGRFIIHRRQSCCPERLGNNQIYIFTGNRLTNRQLCVTIPATGLSQYEVRCSSPITGDGVELFINSGYINFGEIEIYEF